MPLGHASGFLAEMSRHSLLQSANPKQRESVGQAKGKVEGADRCHAVRITNCTRASAQSSNRLDPEVGEENFEDTKVEVRGGDAGGPGPQIAVVESRRWDRRVMIGWVGK